MKFVEKFVLVVAAIPSCSKQSSHLLPLPRSSDSSIAFSCALLPSSLSLNTAAVKYLVTSFSQDLACFFLLSKGFGSTTLI